MKIFIGAYFIMTKPKKQTSTEGRMTATVWYVFKSHNYLASVAQKVWPSWAGEWKQQAA